jgi:hypothetical protein
LVCGRKGRSHYHLKECKDLEKCEAKFNPSVRHTTESFYPYEDKIFDKWLCHAYWSSMNWEQPIDGEKATESTMCNFVCCHPTHYDELKYCNGNAWHSEAHSFDCDHKTGKSNILDIVFCMDTTNSMSSYLK